MTTKTHPNNPKTTQAKETASAEVISKSLPHDPNTRLLTPSQVEALREDMRQSLKQMGGLFKNLA